MTRVAFSLVPLLDNHRLLLFAPSTASGYISDDLEAPQHTENHRLLLAGGSGGPPRVRGRAVCQAGPPSPAAITELPELGPNETGGAGPTRPFLFKGSATPPIQMSMLLGVRPGPSASCQSRFLRTVPSSPCWALGAHRSALQALYPAWEELRVVVVGRRKATLPTQ